MAAAAAVIDLFFEWSKAIGQCRLLSSFHASSIRILAG